MICFTVLDYTLCVAPRTPPPATACTLLGGAARLSIYMSYIHIYIYNYLYLFVYI